MPYGGCRNIKFLIQCVIQSQPRISEADMSFEKRRRYQRVWMLVSPMHTISQMVMQLKGSRVKFWETICFAEPEVTDTPILKKHKDILPKDFIVRCLAIQ